MTSTFDASAFAQPNIQLIKPIKMHSGISKFCSKLQKNSFFYDELQSLKKEQGLKSWCKT